MRLVRRITSAIATAALLGALLGSAPVARSANPVDCKVTAAGKTVIKEVATSQACSKLGGNVVHPVYCQFKKPSKRATKQVASPQDCFKRGGTVVKKEKHPRGSHSQKTLN